MGDTQKVFQHLFDADGQPKEHFGQTIKDVLKDQGMPHYIDSFCIKSEHRGKGLSEHAMLAYLGAITKALGPAPVVLSPAPLRAETIRMREAKKVPGPNAAIVQKLVSFYDKTDYKMAHQGSKRKAGTITVMVRDSSAVEEAKITGAKGQDADVEMTDVENANIVDNGVLDEDETSTNIDDGSSDVMASAQQYDEEEIIVAYAEGDDSEDSDSDGDFTPDQTNDGEEGDPEQETSSARSSHRISKKELDDLN
ncbi:hypothetical protein M409DRAFT_54051 [Zasmidium cellare ATCC 36951]|uniref:N-acetyltransferase domain-containing protein n=1 Tax=Zasmidium cellare ATCC 36951 TaxID=1080233 RepID=A0A6A6CLE4_ZASCE|nr:uncharacterized protein M409DRAFT_54051 [Zasmidium cellare ATCC 36951]KAF2167453.1 hypothetical protein M409DRAFT_54051 [Zasmidium cellare ATCC 36951]